jgi:coenzyme F420-reducing hydrogenase delta subunit
VFVAGCLEGGCHFVEGNLRARRRVERIQGMMREIGIEPERLEMFNLSSADGGRFAEIVTEMANRLKELGPSPLRRTSREVEAGIQDMTDLADTAIRGAAQ